MTFAGVEVEGPDQYDPTQAPPLLDLLEAVERWRPDWHRDALCREFPAVSWFPRKGEPAAAAKRVCGRCLALTDCRAWALEQGPELAGIFGGLSPQDRAKRRAAEPPAPVQGRVFALAPLEEASGMSRRALAGRLGVATSTLQVASKRGITRESAESWAARLGLVPEAVWPKWAELLAS